MRFEKSFKWGLIQLSGIMPVLTARDNQNKIIFKIGWGIAASSTINSWTKGKWYLQASCGQAITPFINNLSGKGLDVIIAPGDSSATLPLTFGGYIGYEHNWTKNLFSNIVCGITGMDKNYIYYQDNFFLRGTTYRVNTFYEIIEGAKMGGEVIWGKRVDMDASSGNALRINLLFYYDF